MGATHVFPITPVIFPGGDYVISMTEAEYKIFQSNQKNGGGGGGGAGGVAGANGSGGYNLKLNQAQFDQYQAAGYFNGMSLSATKDGKLLP